MKLNPSLRIRQLLDSQRPTADWRRRSVDLAGRTTRGSILEAHPLLRTLRDLDQGWLDRSNGLRVAKIFPALDGVAIATAIELELSAEDELGLTGPAADFDPLNSVQFANIPFMSVWYSLVSLPDEPIERWPVVQCDPSAGDDSEHVVAVDVEHFIHQWMCRDGPEYLSPLADVPDPAAAEIIRLMGLVFGISVGDATEALRLQRAEADATPGLAPYVPHEDLHELDQFLVLP